MQYPVLCKAMNTLERAFELARSGICHDVDELEKRLINERYDDVRTQMRSSSLRKQLRAVIVQARQVDRGTPHL